MPFEIDNIKILQLLLIPYCLMWDQLDEGRCIYQLKLGIFNSSERNVGA